MKPEALGFVVKKNVLPVVRPPTRRHRQNLSIDFAAVHGSQFDEWSVGDRDGCPGHAIDDNLVAYDGVNGVSATLAADIRRDHARCGAFRRIARLIRGYHFRIYDRRTGIRSLARRESLEIEAVVTDGVTDIPLFAVDVCDINRLRGAGDVFDFGAAETATGNSDQRCEADNYNCRAAVDMESRRSVYQVNLDKCREEEVGVVTQ